MRAMKFFLALFLCSAPVVASSLTPEQQAAPATLDAGAVAQWAAEVAWSAVDFEARGIGDITLVSGSCPSPTITILGVPVTVNASTIFAGGTCADLAVGRRVDVRAILQLTGGTLTVVARRIEFVTAREVEFEGRVATVTGTCPTLTITLVGGKVITTSETTTFDPSTACGSIAPGKFVEARGTVSGSNQLAATRVEVEGDGGETTIEARVLTVTGTCPALSIGVEGGGIVITNASTIFAPEAGCVLLTPGARIRVRGTTQSDGSLLASRVDLRENGRRHVAGEGTVASLQGTCPSLAMVVQGVRVTTTAATQFVNGECGNLRPGTKVAVDGGTESDVSVTATSIRIVDQPGGRPVEGEGHVGNVSGTCPTLTMVVSGYPVMTTSSTTFLGTRGCSAIRPGARIFVRGTIAGGSVLATEVTVR